MAKATSKIKDRKELFPQQDIGGRLRLRRRSRQLSLEDLSAKTGLSTGLLSQIERSVTAPSLRSLQEICKALEMPVGWLFEPGDERDSGVVVRPASRRRIDLRPRGMVKELMSPDSMPDIQMIRIILQPGCVSGDAYKNDRGAKCGTVVSGSLGLEVDGTEYTLQPGDSFAFPATQLHRFWCVGDVPVDLLWIVAPALY